MRAQRPGRRTTITAVVLGVIFLSACTDDAVPTTPTGAAAAGAPVLDSVDATNQGDGLVILKAKATNPGGGTLNFKWTADEGTLSQSTGAQVLWKPPKKAGTYNATVEVSNAKGLMASGTQKFQVGADGSASAAGGLDLVAASANSVTQASTKPGTGAITFPSPIGSQAPQPIIVSGVAAPPPKSTPPPIFSQPVATFAPGTTSPTPTTPPAQPIATPTPTPLPTVLPASPPPTPKPPTPKPEVPQPPDAIWTQISPFLVPTNSSLRDVFFLREADGSFKEGWAVGDNGAAVHSSDGGKTWDLRNSGLPTSAYLRKVVFTGPDNGFASDDYSVYRYTGGAKKIWERFSNGPDPTKITSLGSIIALAPVNEQIVTIGTSTGNIYRSDNANAAAAAGVSFNPLPTKGAADDISAKLYCGVAFPNGDPTAAWFGGDHVFKLDSDAVAPSPTFKRFANVPGAGNYVSCIDQGSLNDVWAGTNFGQLFFSKNAGAATPTFDVVTKFQDRESNGNLKFFTVQTFFDVSVVDASNVFALRGSNILDTKDGGATWRETLLPNAASSIFIQDQTIAGKRHFIGWAVGLNGTMMRLFPPDQI